MRLWQIGLVVLILLAVVAFGASFWVEQEVAEPGPTVQPAPTAPAR